jgi:hypothetical protein
LSLLRERFRALEAVSSTNPLARDEMHRMSEMYSTILHEDLLPAGFTATDADQDELLPPDLALEPHHRGFQSSVMEELAV